MFRTGGGQRRHGRSACRRKLVNPLFDATFLAGELSGQGVSDDLKATNPRARPRQHHQQRPPQRRGRTPAPGARTTQPATADRGAGRSINFEASVPASPQTPGPAASLRRARSLSPQARSNADPDAVRRRPSRATVDTMLRACWGYPRLSVTCRITSRFAPGNVPMVTYESVRPWNKLAIGLRGLRPTRDLRVRSLGSRRPRVQR